MSGPKATRACRPIRRRRERGVSPRRVATLAAGPLLEPIRAEDAPGAVLEPQTEDVAGVYSGPYRAGGVWAVLDGAGTVIASRRPVQVDGPGCYELICYERSTEGELELEIPAGVRCHAVCFTPGLA